MPPTAIRIYEENRGHAGVVGLCWETYYVLVVVVATSFLLILYFSKRKILGSFVSLQSGKDMIIRTYQESTKDEAKIKIFKRTRKLWYNIENEVKEWVEKKWFVWEHEKPKWFDDNIKMLIPLDFIPDKQARWSIMQAKRSVMDERKKRKSTIGTFAGPVYARKQNTIKNRKVIHSNSIFGGAQPLRSTFKRNMRSNKVASHSMTTSRNTSIYAAGSHGSIHLEDKDEEDHSGMDLFMQGHSVMKMEFLTRRRRRRISSTAAMATAWNLANKSN